MTKSVDDDVDKISIKASLDIASLNSIDAQKASDLAILDSNNFLEMWERVKNKPAKFRRGNLFETIIAAKEDTQNALDGSSKKIIVTHLDGRHTAPADIETYNSSGKMISEGQAKFSVMSGRDIADRINDPKYKGMDIYVPSNKINSVKKELQRLIKNSNNAKEKRELEAVIKHIKSHNTSTVEVIKADRAPKEYATKYKFSIYCKNELLQTTAAASASGATMALMFSSLKNCYSISNNEITFHQAYQNIAKDMTIGAVKSGIIGGTSSIIRFGIKNQGINIKNPGSIANNAAFFLFSTGCVVYDYAKGDITKEQMFIKIGNESAGTLTSLFAGAVMGAAINPVIVGFGGYYIGTIIYQSCIEILENAKLAEEEAKKVVELCELASKELIESRIEFENWFNTIFKERQEEFSAYLNTIDEALESEDFVLTAETLGDFSLLFSKELEMVNFDEFNDFMINSNAPLRL